jgi:hypothetical protein
MSLKYKISKTDFDGLDDSRKAFYKASGDGYELSIDGLPQPEDTSGLKQKVEDLLGESKAAKQKAREADERAQNEATQRAKEGNDFKSLDESSDGEREKSRQELDSLRKTIASEKTDNAAMKISGELAEGINAELLAEFVKRRIRYEDGRVQVLDTNGNPTVSTVDDLKKEFASSGRYDSLLKGNKSGGGGAAPNTGGGAVTKKFNELTGAELKEIKAKDPDLYKKLADDFHNR